MSAAKVALVLEHDRMTHLGHLEPVLRGRGYEIRVVDAPSADFGSIDPLEADVLVVLGSANGVYETDTHPFIAREIDFVRARLEAKRPTLGVCFGTQLMAAALGSRVYKGPTTQIGFREIELTAAGKASPVRHFDGVRVLQWHGDTFELPKVATLLASSSDYAHEAYRVDDWALGVQFHPEVTTAMHEEWMKDDADALVRLGIDQDALRRERELYTPAMREACELMLGEWLEGLDE